ncbi:MAG: iron ABC transporter permease [Burkholderiales bacterium]|nr:iron ABC transporter permease [Burkholderiales bacterium]
MSHSTVKTLPLRSTKSRWLFVASLFLFMLLSFFASVIYSESGALWSVPLNDPEALQFELSILYELRLPRTLTAMAVGGLLSLSGVLMQVLLRNPLADPYVLGISGGASVGALLCLLITSSMLAVYAGAFVGALLVILLVFIFAQRGYGTDLGGQVSWLLTGVAVAAFSGALSSLLLSLAPEGVLRGMVLWLLGDLSSGLWFPPLIILIVSFFIAWPMSRKLNVLGLGSESAHALGLDAHRLRLRVYLLSALMTAFAVTSAGLIGFLGLIIPHAVRLVVSNDHRWLIPASVFGGASLLVLSDMVARLLLAPQQLPVGVVTALIGAPVFLYLLQRRGH